MQLKVKSVGSSMATWLKILLRVQLSIPHLHLPSVQSSVSSAISLPSGVNRCRGSCGGAQEVVGLIKLPNAAEMSTDSYRYRYTHILGRNLAIKSHFYLAAPQRQFVVIESNLDSSPASLEGLTHMHFYGEASFSPTFPPAMGKQVPTRMLGEGGEGCKRRRSRRRRKHFCNATETENVLLVRQREAMQSTRMQVVALSFWPVYASVPQQLDTVER